MIMEMFENRLLQNSGCPLQGVVLCVGRARAEADVVAVAFVDTVGAAPVMPMTSSVVDERNTIVLEFLNTDKDAKDEDSGVISVTRLLGMGVTESEDRIEDSCADTHGDKMVQSSRGIVGRIMRIVIDDIE
jgi:hypothetical protein